MINGLEQLKDFSKETLLTALENDRRFLIENMNKQDRPLIISQTLEFEIDLAASSVENNPTQLLIGNIVIPGKDPIFNMFINEEGLFSGRAGMVIDAIRQGYYSIRSSIAQIAGAQLVAFNSPSDNIEDIDYILNNLFELPDGSLGLRVALKACEQVVFDLKGMGNNHRMDLLRLFAPNPDMAVKPKLIEEFVGKPENRQAGWFDFIDTRSNYLRLGKLISSYYKYPHHEDGQKSLIHIKEFNSTHMGHENGRQHIAKIRGEGEIIIEKLLKNLKGHIYANNGHVKMIDGSFGVIDPQVISVSVEDYSKFMEDPTGFMNNGGEYLIGAFEHIPARLIDDFTDWEVALELIQKLFDIGSHIPVAVIFNKYRDEVKWKNGH